MRGVKGMPRRKQNIRSVAFVALITAIAVCMAMLFTGYIFNVGYEHSCIDGRCGICGLVLLVKHGTDMLLLACVGLCATAELYVSYVRTVCGVRHDADDTPVLMKVKLLN